MITRQIDHYEILEKVGEGGMGEVYRARDSQLGREVAIKVLPASFSDDAQRLRRFELEARTTGALNHPNLITVFGLGTYDGGPYIVMELVEGETLRRAINSGRITESKAIDYGIQIARGLAASHDKGITHRDLKPGNIFLTRDGRVKILDFGLAKLADSAAQELATTIAATTTPGTVLGTVGYMSPEQVRGEGADARSDLFSLGVVLFEMLTGRRAFEGDTAVGVMNAILTEDPPSISSGLPAADRVVRRCMEKQPEERFQSGHDLAFALEAIQASGESMPVTPVSGGGRARLPRRVALGIAALALLAGGYLLGRARLTDRAPATTWASLFRPLHMSQQTFLEGSEGQVNISPDGQSIVFVKRPALESDGADIWMQRVGGENAINLTADTAQHDYHPAFSPDGQRVAFRSERDGGGIFVMGSTGEAVRRLTDFGYNPAWSPDGRFLVVADEAIFHPFGRSLVSALWRVDVTTLQTEKIYPGDAVQPRWSPRGDRIAFWGLPEGTGKRVLYTIPVAGGEPVALTDDDFFNWAPEWSSDGKILFFSSDRLGSMDIWGLPIDPDTGRSAGSPFLLTLSADASRWPSLSRDGRRLAYATQRTQKIMGRVPVDLEAGTIGEPQDLWTTPREVWKMAPSYDGKWIVSKIAEPSEDLFVSAVDGSGLRRLTDDAYKDRVPIWTHDSSRIIFFSDRSGLYQTWSVRPDGSGLTQLTDLANGVTDSRPSPDGKLLVTASLGRAGLVDLTGDLPATEIDWLPNLPNGELFYATDFSPDGTHLLGIAEDYSVWIYSVADQTYERVADRSPYPIWQNDQRILIPEGGKLLAVDLPSKRQSVVFEFPNGFQHQFEISGWKVIDTANGQWIYYLKASSEGDIWMLELAAGP